MYYYEVDYVLLLGDFFIISKKNLYLFIRRFSVDMNENIDSGVIIDEIKLMFICFLYGEEIVYNEELYKSYVLRYRD